MGNTIRQANSSEIACLRSKNEQIKAVIAELAFKNRMLNIKSEGMKTGR